MIVNPSVLKELMSWKIIYRPKRSRMFYRSDQLRLSNTFKILSVQTSNYVKRTSCVLVRLHLSSNHSNYVLSLCSNHSPDSGYI